jgi:hypothetical protein
MLQRVGNQYPAFGGMAHAAPAHGMHPAVGNKHFGFFSTGRVNRFQTHAPGACARRFHDCGVFAGFIADCGKRCQVPQRQPRNDVGISTDEHVALAGYQSAELLSEIFK